MNYEEGEFKRFEKLYGNKFVATVVIAEQARELRKKYNYVISESEALSWILSSISPKNLEHRLEMAKRNKLSLDRLAEEESCYIDSKLLKEALKASIQESKKKKYIEYCYKDLPEEDRPRLRVLVNKIWYEYQDNK